MTGASTSANHVTATSNGSGPRATSHISGKSRMVEISKSGSGEGLGGVIPRGLLENPTLPVSNRRCPGYFDSRGSHDLGMKSRVHPNYTTKTASGIGRGTSAHS